MEQKDNQFGLSQENVEELRSEFISFGGIVERLPDVGDVRDWTMVGIPSRDADGVDTISLFLMMTGKWFHLNEYQAQATGAYGSADQYDTGTVINFGGTPDLVEVTSGWTAGAMNNILYSGGVFKIQRAGNYKISWAISFAIASGNNKEFEAGVLKNGVVTEQGWAHRKIATNDIGSFSASTIVPLKKNDLISLGVINETDTIAMVIDHISFTIFRIR